MSCNHSDLFISRSLLAFKKTIGIKVVRRTLTMRNIEKSPEVALAISPIIKYETSSSKYGYMYSAVLALPLKFT